MINKKIYKNIITLIGGTGVAQVVPVLIAPLLTRLYSPSDFGLLAIFISITSIIGAVASGRYEMAILLPETDKKGKHIFYIAFTLIITTTLISVIIFALWGTNILEIFEVGQFQLTSILIPCGIFLYATFNTYTYLLNRIRKYKGIAISKVLRSTGVSASQLLLGFFSFTIYGLIIGKIVGDTISFIYNQWLVSKEEKLKHIYPNWELMKEQIKIYQEFPKINAPHAFTNTASSNLPNILLATFSPAIAGYYNLSHRVCFAPIQLISSSVQQVYSKEVTDLYNNGDEIFNFTKSIVKKLALFAIVPFSILLIFGPQIFTFVFGSEWETAGVFAQVLTPFMYLVFVTSPLSYIPLMLNYQRKAFLIDIIYLIFRISALAAGLLLASELIAVAAFSAVGVSVQLYLLIWILSLTKDEIE